MIDKIQYKNPMTYKLSSLEYTNKKLKMDDSHHYEVQKSNFKTWDQTTYDMPQVEQAISNWDEVARLIGQDDETMANCYKEGYRLEDQTLQRFEQTPSPRYQYTQDESTKEKIERVKQHTDGMYLYGLTTNEDLTLGNLYKASFTGSNKKENKDYTSANITSLISMNQIADTQGNRQAIGKLLELGMDVNEENVVKYQNIQAVVESLEYTFSQNQQEVNTGNLTTNEWIEDPQKAYEERVLMKEDKILYVEKDIAQIVDELAQVDEQMIGKVLESGEEVTINNLRESLFKNTQKALKNQATPPQQNQTTTFNNDQQAIGTGAKVESGVATGIVGGNTELSTELSTERETTRGDEVNHIKEQIREIRARLNVESAYKLSEKMPLESSELAKVAEGLRQIEEETIEQAVKEVALAPTTENKEQVRQVMLATQAMERHPEQAMQVQLATSETASLEEIHQAIQVYEETGTVAEKRFGETHNKVDAQIEQFLETHGLPKSHATLECAKALIANQMDLTLENLEGVRPIFEKMSVLLEEMTPHQAANFVKEGLNPYKASINHLVEWISSERLPQMKDSVASTIVSLEEKGKITQAQKQSLIGLYRILHGTHINKEQVVGYLYKNELPLTIEHLEEAVKYADKKNTITANIDDAFGELETIKYTRQTAKQMIDEVKGEIKRLADLSKVLEQEEIPVTKEKLENLTKLNSILYPFIKQNVKRELGKFEGTEILPQNLQDKLTRIKDMKPEVLEMMQRQEIPITIANLCSIDELFAHPGKYKELLEEVGLAKEKLPETFEALEESLKALEEEVQTNKENAAQQGDMMGYKNYKQLEEMVELQKHLSQKSGVYHVPFIINGEMKQVDLYINQHKKNQTQEDVSNGLSVVMRYDTKALGQVMAYINIKGDEITYKVTGKDARATQALEKEEKTLKHILEKVGYHIHHSEYASSQPTTILKVANQPMINYDGTFAVEV